MTEVAEHYDVLKELRKIRKKHYQETKNMSIEEHMTYIHQKSQAFRQELAEYKKIHGNANTSQ